MQLNIDQHLMDIIEHDHSNDCERCCSKMFSKWLGSNPTASWKDIITAMDNLSSNGMHQNYKPIYKGQTKLKICFWFSCLGNKFVFVYTFAAKFCIDSCV